MSFLIHLFSQPILYTSAVSLGLAFYMVWVLARQQYLGTLQQFNLLSISLVAIILASITCQILYPGYIFFPTSWPGIIAAFDQPFTIVSLLCGYIAALLASWQYLRHIRYPFWRMMDSNAMGINLIALGWLVGSVINQPNLTLGLATVVLAIIFLGLLALYQKTERTGLVSSAHVVTIFGLCLGLQYMLVPWQGDSSVVEYVAGGVAILVGIIAFAIRLQGKVSHTTLTQLPIGVSQKFRETFSTLVFRQPSSSDGSSHKKS